MSEAGSGSELSKVALHYALVLAGAVVGGGIAFIILVNWMSPPLYFIGQPYVTAKAADVLTTAQANSLLELIKLGVVTPMDAALEQLISFYSTIITMLLGLIAVVNLIAYMYIRSKSMEHAEDISLKSVETCVKRYFDSKPHEKMVHEVVSGFAGPLKAELSSTVNIEIQYVLERLEATEDLAGALSKLQQEVREVADSISQQSKDIE